MTVGHEGTTRIKGNGARVAAEREPPGVLIDADLVQEMGRLEALRARQRLGPHALSGANGVPQTLLKLFRQA